MSARRAELTRAAARLFAQKGYHGTSIGDLAEAMGVQKGSLYAHIDSKADLLWEVARNGATAFHAALDTVPEELPATDKIRLALRAHLRVIAEQLEIATVFIREWKTSSRKTISTPSSMMAANAPMPTTIAAAGSKRWSTPGQGSSVATSATSTPSPG